MSADEDPDELAARRASRQPASMRSFAPRRRWEPTTPNERRVYASLTPAERIAVRVRGGFTPYGTQLVRACDELDRRMDELDEIRAAERAELEAREFPADVRLDDEGRAGAPKVEEDSYVYPVGEIRTEVVEEEPGTVLPRGVVARTRTVDAEGRTVGFGRIVECP